MSTISSELHSTVINFLFQEDVNYRDIVIEIAKKHPEVLVEIISSKKKVIYSWHQTVVAYIKENRRVEAVKLVREKLGYSLKEALDLCNYVQRLLWSYNKIERDYDGFVERTYADLAEEIVKSSN